MGKHSAPESPGFWRAVILAGLRYLVVLLLLFAMGFGVYQLVFDRDQADPEAEEFTPVPEDPFLPEDPIDTDPGTPPGEATGRTQVLDGSGSLPRRNAAVQKLQDAGYEVVSQGNTANPQERTVIAYQPGHQQMGEAVASLLGASLVEPVGDRNLDPSIPVSVLIGPDYAG